MTIINRLAGAASGIHFADQIALVSVPLAAALIFDASAQTIGILVACQSLAHLFGSLPFGLVVDRSQLRTLVLSATLISFFGFLGGSTSIFSGSLAGFGTSITFAGFGVVLFTLSALSIIPLSVEPAKLAHANATIELPRTLMSFCVPLVIGLAITQFSLTWVFPAAAAGAAIAFIMSMRLPQFSRMKPASDSIFSRLKDGGSFVINNNLLRAISLCAIFWNFAFTALLVAMVPLLSDYYLLDPGTFGTALAAFGLATIAGTWIARQYGEKFAPNIILVLGPAASVIAVLILYTVPPGGSVHIIHAAFFILGFGPAMWLITQNSVRQLITPANMLGRVNSVIQTAIYGMRPIGALIGGGVVEATSPETGLVVVIVAFFLSFLAAAFSQLRFIKRYSELEGPENG